MVSSHGPVRYSPASGLYMKNTRSRNGNLGVAAVPRIPLDALGRDCNAPVMCLPNTGAFWDTNFFAWRAAEIQFGASSTFQHGGMRRARHGECCRSNSAFVDGRLGS